MIALAWRMSRASDLPTSYPAVQPHCGFRVTSDPRALVEGRCHPRQGVRLTYCLGGAGLERSNTRLG